MRSQNTIFTENGETDEESEKRSQKVTTRNAFCEEEHRRVNEVLTLSTVFFFFTMKKKFRWRNEQNVRTKLMSSFLSTNLSVDTFSCETFQ